MPACTISDINSSFIQSPISLDTDKFNAGVFYYDNDDAYISSVRSELDKLFVKSNINYIEFDAKSSQSMQDSQIESAIYSGIDLLIINIVNSGSADSADEICLRARHAGIPVIFFNRPIEGVGDEGVILNYYKSVVFIGSDLEESSHLQGQLIGEYLVDNYSDCDLNDDGKISYTLMKGEARNAEAIYRTTNSVNDTNEILTDHGYPELEFFNQKSVDKFQLDLTGKWSLSSAQSYMTSNLTHYNDANGNMIELVICNNDSMAEGCIYALQDAGYNKPDNPSKRIPVFGFDATPSAQKMISDGSMTGTIVQDPYEMANHIIHIAKNVKNGEDMLKGTEEYLYDVEHNLKNSLLIPCYIFKPELLNDN